MKGIYCELEPRNMNNYYFFFFKLLYTCHILNFNYREFTINYKQFLVIASMEYNRSTLMRMVYADMPAINIAFLGIFIFTIVWLIIQLHLWLYNARFSLVNWRLGIFVTLLVDCIAFTCLSHLICLVSMAVVLFSMFLALKLFPSSFYLHRRVIFPCWIFCYRKNKRIVRCNT